MISLETNTLKAEIALKGAELKSLYHKKHQIEYLWAGNPAFWGKHSPVLFPIVGALKDDVYTYDGKSYTLPRHGFARDMFFEADQIAKDKAVFTLSSTAETRKHYPFEFTLRLVYELIENTLKVSYEVVNPAEKTLYFSIGGHPAFAVPLINNTRYEDYYLEFEKPETTGRWPLSGNLIDVKPKDFLQDERKIPLQKELFYKDAIVLKNLKSKRISLLSAKTSHGFHFHFDGFPFLGIWAAKDAPFVCIEPWCGIADSVGHNQKIEEKEGIIALTANTIWQRSWSVECL